MRTGNVWDERDPKKNQNTQTGRGKDVIFVSFSYLLMNPLSLLF